MAAKSKVLHGTWAYVRQKYNTEQKCEQLFLQHLWSNGIKCPKCEYANPITNKIHANKQKTFVGLQCSNCGKKIKAKIDCIFTKSQLDFRTWLEAVYRIAIKHNSTPSNQMVDEIGVEQDTAWFLFLRISQLAEQNIKLDTAIEMDEWYFNSDPKYKHDYQQSIFGSDKGIVGESKPIIGAVQRAEKHTDKNGNTTILRPAQYVLQSLNIKGKRSVASCHIEAFRDRYIQNSEDTTVYTDDAKIYKKAELFKNHKSIPHNVKNESEVAGDLGKGNSKQQKMEHHAKFVNGDIHTNNIEGLFSRLSYYFATHRSISQKHVQKYLDMMIFRENNRDLTTEEKIHKYLSCLNKVPHTKRDELVGNEPTGRISKKMRFFYKENNNLIPNLTSMPYEYLQNRNTILEAFLETFKEYLPKSYKGDTNIHDLESNKKLTTEIQKAQNNTAHKTNGKYAKFILDEFGNLHKPTFEQSIQNLVRRIGAGKDLSVDQKESDEIKKERYRGANERYRKKMKAKKLK